MSILLAGGWVLWVIMGLSVTACAIVVQKIWLLRTIPMDTRWLGGLISQLNTSTAASISQELKRSPRMDYQLAAIAIDHFQSDDTVIAAKLQARSRAIRERLASQIDYLTIIGTVAPVLGLLGTVLGLMDVFSVLSAHGVEQTTVLSAGISKALITTVAGLSLAVPLLFANQYVSSTVHRHIGYWNEVPTQIIAHLRGL
jgi:biopolymer transport protein ExbB